jgi:hypothetical protein
MSTAGGDNIENSVSSSLGLRKLSIDKTIPEISDIALPRIEGEGVINMSICFYFYISPLLASYHDI